MFSFANTCIQLPVYLLGLSETSSASLFPMMWWGGSDYLIIWLFPAIILSSMCQTGHRSQQFLSSQPHNKAQNKRVLFGIVCLWIGSLQLMKLVETAVVIKSRMPVHTLVNGGGKTRRGKMWLASFSGSQLWKGRKWGQPQYREPPTPMTMYFFTSFHYLFLLKDLYVTLVELNGHLA